VFTIDGYVTSLLKVNLATSYSNFIGLTVKLIFHDT